MEAPEKVQITLEATVHVDVATAWMLWTTPEHITKWNTASPDWHTPWAENDLRVGGKFTSRMEAKDGSFGFDFWGIYDDVKPNESIMYTMGDGRKATVSFSSIGNQTKVIEIFEAETENSVELQREGWQAILNSFKQYAESDRS